MVTFFGIQIVGIGFGLLMGYLAFVSLKKGELSRVGFGLWGLIWASFLFAVVFPDALSGIVGRLNIIRLMDFLTIGSFMLLFGMSFWMYKVVGKLEKRVTEMAVDRAVADAPKKGPGRRR